MADNTITLRSTIDPDTYRRFALYDVIKVKRNWIRPVIFAAAFVILSVIAFVRKLRIPGILLLVIGFGLPAVYYWTFYRSVLRSANQYDGRKKAYTVTLDDRGVTVSKGRQNVTHEWSSIHSAHRLKTCICIYTDPAHAILLAGRNTVSRFDDVMEFIRGHVDESRVHVQR